VIISSAVRDIGTAARAAICRTNARALGQRCAASDRRSPFLSFKPANSRVVDRLAAQLANG
jgi:hypothetical protein